MGTFLGGPNNKACTMLGSMLGPPYLGKPPYVGIYIRISSMLGICRFWGKVLEPNVP